MQFVSLLRIHSIIRYHAGLIGKFLHATADRCSLIIYYLLPLFLPLLFPRTQVIRRETRQQMMLSNLLKPQEFQRFSRHFMTPCGTGEDVLKCCRTNPDLSLHGKYITSKIVQQPTRKCFSMVVNYYWLRGNLIHPSRHVS